MTGAGAEHRVDGPPREVDVSAPSGSPLALVAHDLPSFRRFIEQLPGTQKEIAEGLLGCTREHLGAVLSGRKTPSPTLVMLAGRTVQFLELQREVTRLGGLLEEKGIPT